MTFNNIIKHSLFIFSCCVVLVNGWGVTAAFNLVALLNHKFFHWIYLPLSLCICCALLT